MKKIDKINKELFDAISNYLDMHKNADREDGAAAYLLCKEENNAKKLIAFLAENPDIDSYDLFIKALEIAESDTE